MAGRPAVVIGDRQAHQVVAAVGRHETEVRRRAVGHHLPVVCRDPPEVAEAVVQPRIGGRGAESQRLPFVDRPVLAGADTLGRDVGDLDDPRERADATVLVGDGEVHRIGPTVARREVEGIALARGDGDPATCDGPAHRMRQHLHADVVEPEGGHQGIGATNGQLRAGAGGREGEAGPASGLGVGQLLRPIDQEHHAMGVACHIGLHLVGLADLRGNRLAHLRAGEGGVVAGVDQLAVLHAGLDAGIRRPAGQASRKTAVAGQFHGCLGAGIGEVGGQREHIPFGHCRRDAQNRQPGGRRVGDVDRHLLDQLAAIVVGDRQRDRIQPVVGGQEAEQGLVAVVDLLAVGRLHLPQEGVGVGTARIPHPAVQHHGSALDPRQGDGRRVQRRRGPREHGRPEREHTRARKQGLRGRARRTRRSDHEVGGGRQGRVAVVLHAHRHVCRRRPAGRRPGEQACHGVDAGTCRAGHQAVGQHVAKVHAVQLDPHVVQAECGCQRVGAADRQQGARARGGEGEAHLARGLAEGLRLQPVDKEHGRVGVGRHVGLHAVGLPDLGGQHLAHLRAGEGRVVARIDQLAVLHAGLDAGIRRPAGQACIEAAVERQIGFVAVDAHVVQAECGRQ